MLKYLTTLTIFFLSAYVSASLPLVGPPDDEPEKPYEKLSDVLREVEAPPGPAATADNAYGVIQLSSSIYDAANSEFVEMREAREEEEAANRAAEFGQLKDALTESVMTKLSLWRNHSEQEETTTAGIKHDQLQLQGFQKFAIPINNELEASSSLRFVRSPTESEYDILRSLSRAASFRDWNPGNDDLGILRNFVRSKVVDETEEDRDAEAVDSSDDEGDH